jgi:tRNA G37 N-methylase TrmD
MKWRLEEQYKETEKRRPKLIKLQMKRELLQ